MEWSQAVASAASQDEFASLVKGAREQWVLSQKKSSQSELKPNWLEEAISDDRAIGVVIAKTYELWTTTELERKLGARAFDENEVITFEDEAGRMQKGVMVDPQLPRQLKFESRSVLSLHTDVANSGSMLRPRQHAELHQHMTQQKFSNTWSSHKPKTMDEHAKLAEEMKRAAESAASKPVAAPAAPLAPAQSSGAMLDEGLEEKEEEVCHVKQNPLQLAGDMGPKVGTGRGRGQGRGRGGTTMAAPQAKENARGRGGRGARDGTAAKRTVASVCGGSSVAGSSRASSWSSPTKRLRLKRSPRTKHEQKLRDMQRKYMKDLDVLSCLEGKSMRVHSKVGP